MSISKASCSGSMMIGLTGAAIPEDSEQAAAHVVAFLRWLVHDTHELPPRADGGTSLTR
ncbi:hypothetical protein [Nocardia sp. NPDC005825]|uniref:hypothetical protein n=1 Tax=unclassified Nocardia TaxID=2637762 RepID=UPI0033DA1464